jgi:hypothetical protein
MEQLAVLSEGLERPLDSPRAPRVRSADCTDLRNALKAEKELNRGEIPATCPLWQKKHRRHNSGFGEYLGNRRVLTVETRVSRLPIAGVRRGAAG